MSVPRALLQSRTRFSPTLTLWSRHHHLCLRRHGYHQKPHPVAGLKTAEQSRASHTKTSQSTADQTRESEDESGSGSGTESKGEDAVGLPAPGEGESPNITLDVSGGQSSTVRLGHLGPLVVNTDGTTGRVANWAEMTTFEQETTMRLLNKRNKTRLDALKKAESGSTEGSAGH